MEDETADVLVLGAGAAGLAAAQQLSQAGLRVIVIEARDRVGGRIFTQHVQGHPLLSGGRPWGNSAPSSIGNGWPGTCCVKIRPPTRSRASITMTRKPT